MGRRRISARPRRVAEPQNTDSAAGLVSRTVQDDRQSSALVRPSTEGVQIINAYQTDYDPHHIHLVLPSATTLSGRMIRKVPAEFSCFVDKSDLSEKKIRAMKRHCDVRWIKDEGDWWRIRWVGRNAAKHWCSRMHNTEIQTYEGAINPVLRFMVDNPEYKVARPRRLWVDLETDSRVPFNRMRESRILCWATIDEHGDEQGSTLRSDTDKGERRILAELWEVIENYDQILAWNGDRFDFPVIKARSEFHRLIRSDAEWRQYLWLDQLELFKRYNMAAAESGDEKTSNKLGDVAHALFGEGKDDFDASKTWDAWAAGGSERKRLFKYCAQDTRLMPRIEKETGFADILLTLGQTCGTFGDTRGINPSIQVEGYMQSLAIQRNEKIPTVVKIDKGDPYKGAFVMKPLTIGIMKNVHVADFSSLYPTIIRTWNMSPETLIDPKNYAKGDTQPPEVEQGWWSWSPLTRTAFKVRQKGMLPEAVAEMMRLRQAWNVAKKAEPPGTDAWKDADRRSSAYKIAANSFYGVIGQPTNRLFSRAVAEAVTQCGAWLIKETIKAAEEQGMTVVYGDTDSLFITDSSKREFEKFVKWCNETLYPKILPGVGCTENFINLGYEKEFRRIVFTSAKRYAGSYVHYGGTPATADSKPEIKGLEYKRGDTLRLTRRLQEQVVYMLLGYKCEAAEDPKLFDPLLDKWVEDILHGPLTLDDVVVSKKMGKPLHGANAYSRKRKKDGDWARQLPHVEMARILEKRGRDVSEGTRISYYIRDGSVKGAFEYAPAEDFADDFDRYSLWDDNVAAPTIRVLEAAFPGHDWKPWKRVRPKAPRKARKPKIVEAETEPTVA